MLNRKELYEQSIDLLKRLIATPSLSQEEVKTAAILEGFLQKYSIPLKRKGNNVWAVNRFFDSSKPTLLLNSHHDTVKPNPGYTRDPFIPAIEDGKLYGLGSNDAGGSLVALIATFLYFYERPDLKYNLVLAATAEEEISGAQGIESIWADLPPINCALVGEPTGMEAAISDKGLLVLDCVAIGKAGHAAREEGDNAIYRAIQDIEWFRTFEFPKTSPSLGKVKMTVTIIHAGLAHNQVPSECHFTVDIRVTDVYTLNEVLDTIKQHARCSVAPRSLRLRPSSISSDHPLTLAAKAMGKKLYGSPTTSDRALIPVPALKMGPGDSARSHMADEYIFVREIEQGLGDYIRLIELI